MKLDHTLRQQIRQARDRARRQRILLEDTDRQPTERSIRRYAKRAPTRCVECGADHDARTEGCKRCADRTRRREARHRAREPA